MVEPSTIKLSCQPFSRHECSLVVPRSCFLLSTKGTPSQVLLTAATGRLDFVIFSHGYHLQYWQFKFARHSISIFMIITGKVSLKNKDSLYHNVCYQVCYQLFRKEVPIIRDGSTSCWNVTWCLEQCKLSLYHPLSAMSSYQQVSN